MHELLMVLVALIAQDAVDQIPEVMRRLVCRLAAKLPGEHAEIMREAWLAELEAIPGKLPKLWFLLPLYLRQAEIRRAAGGSAVRTGIREKIEADPSINVLEKIMGLEDQLRVERWRMQMHHKYAAMSQQWREDAEITVGMYRDSTNLDDRQTLESALEQIKDYSRKIKLLESEKIITALEISTLENSLADLNRMYVANDI